MNHAGVDPPGAESLDGLSHRIFTSTAWNYFGYGANLVTWFLLTPFVVSELGARAYGLFVVAAAVMGYAQLFELGMSSAVTRFVAELHERGDAVAQRNLIATAFATATALALVTTTFGLVLAPFAPELFGVAPEVADTTRLLMVVAGLTAGIAFPTATLFAVLAGMQRFDITNLLQVCATLLLAAFTIGALVAGLGVVWVVAAGIPTSILVQIPALIAIRRVAPTLALSSGRPSMQEARRLFSFSWAIVFMQGAGVIKGKTDELIIAAVLPVANVTPYALARRASEGVTALTYQFTKVILPLAAQMGARNERERLRAVFLAGTRLTLAAYLAGACGLAALAGPFLAAWVGEEYRSAGTILVIFAVAGFAEMTTSTMDSVLQGISRHQPLALFAVVGAVANLALSIALIGPLGVKGVALATLITTAAETVILAFPYAMRTLGIGLGVLLVEVIAPVLMPIIPAGAVAVGLQLLVEPSSLALVAVMGTAIGITYLGAYMAIGARDLERQLARRLLAGLTRRLRPVR